MPILYKGAPKMGSQPVKCLQMSLNVSKMSPNVSIETFPPYRLHQSEIPNALPDDDESSITHHYIEEVMAVRYHVQCTTTLAAAKMKRIDLFLVLLLLLIDDE